MGEISLEGINAASVGAGRIFVLFNSLSNVCQTLMIQDKQEHYRISDKTTHQIIDQEHALHLEQSGIVQCGLATCRESFSVYRKSPGQHMLLFTVKGKGWLQSGQERYVLEPGSLIVVPAGCENGFGIEEEDWQLAWLFLTPRHEWRCVAGAHLQYDLTPITDVMFSCIQTLVRTMTLPPELGQRVAQHAVEQINDLLSSPAPNAQSRMHVRLNRAFEQVQKQLHRDWMVDQIAALVPCSVPHLHRLSQSYYHHSPKAHLTRLRMEYAARLLGRSDWSIQHIGEMVGYANSANFSTRFKRWSGKTPREHRHDKKNTFLL